MSERKGVVSSLDCYILSIAKASGEKKAVFVREIVIYAEGLKVSSIWKTRGRYCISVFVFVFGFAYFSLEQSAGFVVVFFF